MAASLLKTSATVSSSVTPNALLYGYFNYTLGGDVLINAPSLATDGQFIAIRLTQPAGTSRNITWDSSYKPGAQALTNGGLGVGDSWYGLFFCDNGSQLLLGSGNF